MSYKAGDLEIELFGIDNNAISSISKTSRALTSLSKAIASIQDTKITGLGTKLTSVFRQLSSAINSIDETRITALSNIGNAFNSISKIGKLEKVDFSKVSKGFEQLSIAITPFLDKIKSAEVSLNALYGTLSKASGKRIQNLLGNGSTSTNSKSRFGAFGFLNFAKWTTIFYASKRLGRAVADIAQSGADYTETLNLWETAMGKNITVATEFVNKMNEAYGISEKTLMNAQAIFKNMLGSLGQISDTTAYLLSEGVTQMAIDYASLYNVTFSKAFEKFQAALAGQVRPIRSVSGYDITENTLFQLYQSLGGTKSVRNLSRTEKQLLSILAVFNQMTASGAVGDLDKTMESFANQSRVMAEAWQEVKTWAGVLLTYIIQESGLLVKVNAVLITTARYFEAVARSLGAIQSFGGDPFGAMGNDIANTNNELDKLTGKLLDFDKFRALSSSDDNVLGLDERLLNALAGYESILGNANNKARELSDQWLKMLGFTIDENGELQLTQKQLANIRKEVATVVEFLSSPDGLSFLTSASSMLKSLFNTLSSLLPIISNIVEDTSPLIAITLQVVKGITDVLHWLGLLDDAILVIIGLKIAYRILQIGSTITKIYKENLLPFITKLKTQVTPALWETNKVVTKTQYAFLGLSASFAMLSLSNFLSTEMSAGKRIVTMFGAIAGAIIAASIAMNIFKQNWAGALSAALVVAGGVLTVSSAIPEFANGASNIDSGTLFIAGEMGKTEAVYTGSNGKTNVANIQQMQTAYRSALNDWWATARQDIPQFREVSRTGIYEIAKEGMVNRGEW